MKRISNTLYWKIAGLFIIVLTILALIYFLVSVQISRKYFDETTQKLNRDVAKHMLLEVNPFKDGKVNEEALGKLMHSMMAVNPNLEVYLLNTEGEILSFVVLNKKVKLKSIAIEPVKKFIANGKLIYGDNPRLPGEKVIFSASEVIENGKLQGYIYMTLNSEQQSNIASTLKGSYMLSLTTKYFFITLVAAIIISLLLLWLLVKRLSAIMEMVRLFKQGNLEQRIGITGKGELSKMATAINGMADTIVKNIDELKEVDALRRELIANISHDLRTPVSVIHGYAETLVIKGDTLDKQKRQEYLSVIIKTSEKLKMLMADLFELSKLEARQVKPKQESFFIFDLLQDMSNKFKLLANEKKISFTADCNSNTPLVCADVSMMERVIQNLVENAIKYTPENGDVSVKVQQMSNQLQVNVTNSGAGIPEEEIPRIFNRYYKVSNSPNNKGTGLGLAIVKNILDIHGIAIHVKSVVNKFTTFSFNLPLAVTK
jgi:signal transduction histidine kinase